MSEEERQQVEYFKQWIDNGGLADWIEHFLNQGNEEKLREVQGVFHEIKDVFGF